MLNKAIMLGVSWGAYKIIQGGGLNPMAKMLMKKKLESLFSDDEEFSTYLGKRTNSGVKRKEHITVEYEDYIYKSQNNIIKTFSLLDVDSEIAMCFSKDKLRFKFKIKTKGIEYKFKLSGKYNIDGQVIEFLPNDGDLELLPERFNLESKEPLRFVVKPDDDELSVIFNMETKESPLTFIED